MSSDLVPTTIYGTVFENSDTKEVMLDAGTLRYTVDGSRLAAKEVLGQMHPENRRKWKPVKIMKLVLTKEGA